MVVRTTWPFDILGFGTCGFDLLGHSTERFRHNWLRLNCIRHNWAGPCHTVVSAFYETDFTDITIGSETSPSRNVKQLIFLHDETFDKFGDFLQRPK